MKRKPRPEDILLIHELATLYPVGSKEWRKVVMLAHRLYLEATSRKRERGRPKGSKIDDKGAVTTMRVLRALSGETNKRQLARSVLHMVPARGDEASRIARLAGRVDEPLGLTRDQIKIIEK